jgi:hypothetical protein
MKRNEKFLEAKQSENTVYLFRFGWKRKIRSEKKRNEAKKKKISRECAKRMRNGSRFASFRFEAKKFLKRNWRTLVEDGACMSVVGRLNKLDRVVELAVLYQAKNVCLREFFGPFLTTRKRPEQH